MSGGEQQSVAIGRALVANPRVLLLDELSLGLAPVIVQRIYAMLPQILDSGVTVLLVEQDVSQALRVATHLQCLLEGRTTLEGTPAEVTARAGRGRVLRPSRTTIRRRGASLMAWVNAIIQGILTGGLYALFACGLSLMFGVMKVVNLAHGDLAVVARLRRRRGHRGHPRAVPVVDARSWCVLMAVLGYVLQRTLIQAALSRGELTTLIVTFGLSIVIENGLLQFFTANSRGIGVGSSLDHRVVHDRLADPRSPGCTWSSSWLAVVVLLGLQYFLSVVEVRPADPRRRRRPGGGAAVRRRLPARVRHRGGDRLRAPWRSPASPTA